jgi:hypothetical protein
VYGRIDRELEPTGIVLSSRGASRGGMAGVIGHGRKAQSSQSTGYRVSGHAISFDPRFVLRAAAQSHGSSVLGLETQNIRPALWLRIRVVGPA